MKQALFKDNHRRVMRKLQEATDKARDLCDKSVKIHEYKFFGDPGTSVVNSFCRSHDVKNLFVIDSSSFVTEGGGDSPSLTIHAIAFRASEYIVTKVKKTGSSFA